MEQDKIDRIKDLSESLFQFEQAQMIDHGSTMPVQYIVKEKGIVAIPAPFESYEEKMQMSKFTTLLAAILEADAIIFLSEAWVSIRKAPPEVSEESTPEEIQKRAEEIADSYKIRPSEDPDRQEKLMLLIYFGSGETMLGYSDILRAGPNARAYTKELEWMADSPDTTQTTRLFKPWKGVIPEAMIENIMDSMPDYLKVVINKLKGSLISGKHIGDQIDDCMEIFGMKATDVTTH